MKVFISYRRDDSIIHARLIRNELAQRFGEDDVFMDIDDIDYGEDFETKINAHLDEADAVVAVIGPQWMDMLQRRARSDDYVRHELSRALQRGIRIVPVLVGKASPPGAGLPDELAGLRKLNALSIDERSLKLHVTALVEALREERFEDEVHKRKHRSLARWTGAGVGLAMFFAAWFSLLDRTGVETAAADLTMWTARPLQSPQWSDEVVVVGIDAASVQAVGRSFDASWRREHARLVERLGAAGVRTVAFDLFFERAGATEDDDAFEAAIRAARSAHAMPVVLGARQMDSDRPLVLPRFAAVAEVGFACLGNKAGYSRSAPLAVQRGKSVFHPSLALAAYTGSDKVIDLEERLRAVRVEVTHDDRAPDLRFAVAENVKRSIEGCEGIRPGDRVAMQWLDPALIPPLAQPPRRLAYETVLAARDPASLSTLKDKVVLVGLMFAGQDSMPVGASGERFGVELIAAQVDAMVRGEVIRPLGWQGLLVVMCGAGLAGAVLGMRTRGRSVAWRAAIAAACVLAAFVLAVLLYRIERAHVGLPYLISAFALAWWGVSWMDKRGWQWSRP